MESDAEEDPIDYNKEVTFPDSDQEDPKLREVSEETEKLLTRACTRKLSRATRLGVRSAHPLPRVPATRTPQLDPVMKSETSTQVKATDKELASIQTMVLDALAPLTTFPGGRPR